MFWKRRANASRSAIAQVGKAFRNEVTPRNFTFRSREFEQMELEFFIKPMKSSRAIHGSVFTPTPNSQLLSPEPNWGWQAWHQYWLRSACVSTKASAFA